MAPRPDHSRSMPVFCGCGNFTTLIHYWQVWGLPFTQADNELYKPLFYHWFLPIHIVTIPLATPSDLAQVLCLTLTWRVTGEPQTTGSLWDTGRYCYKRSILSLLLLHIYEGMEQVMVVWSEKDIVWQKQGYRVVWKVTVRPSTVLHFLWSALTLQCLISKLILRTEAHLLNTPCVTIVSNADILQMSSKHQIKRAQQHFS